MSSYKQLIVDIVDILANDFKITNINYKEIDEVIAFEKELASIIIPDEQRPNMTLHYNLWLMTDLSSTVPFVRSIFCVISLLLWIVVSV